MDVVARRLVASDGDKEAMSKGLQVRYEE